MKQYMKTFFTLAIVVGASSCADPPPQLDELLGQERAHLEVEQSLSAGDVGAVAAPGNYSELGGVYTVEGSGADIFNTADEMHFVYRQISGNTTITARVTSLEQTDAWTKAGVMIREGLAGNAKSVSAVVSPTASNGYRRLVRSTVGGSTASVPGSGSSAIPSWLRVTRSGSSFTAFTSTNGTTWTALGAAITVSMNSTVYVGLAVTSHNDGVVATAKFDRVTVTGAAPPPAAGTSTLTFEAENGFTLTSPLQRIVDSTAGNGQYIQVTPGNNSTGAVPSGGHATYPFAVTTAGIRKLWARVITPTASDDSFWVRVDTQPWVNWNDIDPGTAWQWESAAALQWNLTAGNHTVEIAYREDGAQLDQLLITNDLSLTPKDSPAVTAVAPVHGVTGVNPAGFVATEVYLPNVAGIDATTLAGNVTLQRISDGAAVPSEVNTSGGGDTIVLQPSAPLAEHTLYKFTVTSGVKDVSGAAFVPFVSTFTTGTADPMPTDMSFAKVNLGATASGFPWTSITTGPDGNVYATTLTGEIMRFTVGSTGLFTSRTQINTIRSNSGGARAVIGLAFDPASTASNLILWVTHSGPALNNAPDWAGKLSKLTGANLQTYQDVVVNFPRSIRDHMTNSIAFNPAEPGVIYITQGSMTAMGAPDNAWGQRSEHLLSGAILRVDTSKLPGTLPLNVQTNDSNPTASGYNPYAAGAAVTIFGSGVRNAYDLIWHSNGQLYVPTNGSAAGGNTPATPSPLPSACTRRLDGATNGNYTGPQVSGITNVTVAQHDWLFRVVPNGYYGHPSPSRCEWVQNGGNPTSGVDVAQVAQYPTGTQPDRNWRGFAFDFGTHYSPNGVIEWTSNTIFPGMNGKLLVIRYSGGDDIIALTIDPVTKNVVQSQSGFPGTTGFSDPLDLIADPASGRIYVTELAAERITLLRPQ